MTLAIISSFSAATPCFPTLTAIFDAWMTPSSSSLPSKFGPSSEYDNHADDPQMFRHLTFAAIEPVISEVADRGTCGFILASAKGNIGVLQHWLDLSGGFARDAASPGNPPSLMDCAQNLAAEFGLGGSCAVVSTACTSGLSGLIEAAMMVDAGQQTEIVVLAVDIASLFVCDGFTALKALAAQACRPFDRHRDGLALGSAAAACLVQRSDIFAGKKADTFACTLCGRGAAMDAVHLTAPDRQAGGLIRAVEMALRTGGLSTSQIDAVLLHGTGTPYNDAMEATAVQKIFSHSPPLTAVKGHIGHTLGASGLIETALASEILHRGVLPPTTGLSDSQWPELDFVQTARSVPSIRRILKTSSGFGGINAAVILEKLKSNDITGA